MMKIPGDFRKGFRVACALSKIYITVPVTATAGIGYIVHSGALTPSLLPLLSGVFLLASGSAALNHFQERRTDALMERTMKRPIPSRQVRPGTVLVFSLILLVAGSSILFISFPPVVPLLGLLNFFWYNAVYTPLKKITAFAVIPGALTGGIPPVIGWTAAGGFILDPSIMVIVLFFVIGQIPHFWLLILEYGPQYEKAGLPSVSLIFSPGQIRRISYAWMLAAAASSLLLPLYGLISRPASVLVIMGGIAILLSLMLRQELMSGRARSSKLTFVSLNIFFMLIMTMLTLEALLF
jgi:heme o synthase